MQVLPAAAVEGKLRKRQCRGGAGDPEGSLSSDDCFLSFRQNPELPAPSEEKGRDESNSGSEERSEDRGPGTSSPCLFDSQLKNYFYPAGESIDFEFAYQAYPSKSLRRSGNSSAGFFVPASPLPPPSPSPVPKIAKISRIAN